MQERYLQSLEKQRSAAAGGRPRRIVVADPARPLTPAQCRAWVRKTVAAHMPQIVEGFLNQAAKGGCAHLKMASETVASRVAPPRRSSARSEEDLLMEELRKEFG